MLLDFGANTGAPPAPLWPAVAEGLRGALATSVGLPGSAVFASAVGPPAGPPPPGVAWTQFTAAWVGNAFSAASGAAVLPTSLGGTTDSSALAFLTPTSTCAAAIAGYLGNATAVSAVGTVAPVFVQLVVCVPAVAPNRRALQGAIVPGFPPAYIAELEARIVFAFSNPTAQAAIAQGVTASVRAAATAAALPQYVSAAVALAVLLGIAASAGAASPAPSAAPPSGLGVPLDLGPVVGGVVGGVAVVALCVVGCLLYRRRAGLGQGRFAALWCSACVREPARGGRKSAAPPRRRVPEPREDDESAASDDAPPPPPQPLPKRSARAALSKTALSETDSGLKLREPSAQTAGAVAPTRSGSRLKLREPVRTDTGVMVREPLSDAVLDARRSKLGAAPVVPPVPPFAAGAAGRGSAGAAGSSSSSSRGSRSAKRTSARSALNPDIMTLSEIKAELKARGVDAPKRANLDFLIRALWDALEEEDADGAGAQGASPAVSPRRLPNSVPLPPLSTPMESPEVADGPLSVTRASPTVARSAPPTETLPDSDTEGELDEDSEDDSEVEGGWRWEGARAVPRR